MTSTKDTTGHPDVAEISDLTEGLLAPSRSADVRRHLDACELCADVHASLEEIRGLLGTLPGPPRMPDDVAHRIDAALAAEALLNATTPENADTSPSTDAVTTDTDAPPVSRETTTAADRPAGRAHAATGPGRKDRKRGGRRRIAVLGTVLTVAALGLGSVLVSSLTDGGGRALRLISRPDRTPSPRAGWRGRSPISSPRPRTPVARTAWASQENPTPHHPVTNRPRSSGSPWCLPAFSRASAAATRRSPSRKARTRGRTPSSSCCPTPPTAHGSTPTSWTRPVWIIRRRVRRRFC